MTCLLKSDPITIVIIKFKMGRIGIRPINEWKCGRRFRVSEDRLKTTIIYRPMLLFLMFLNAEKMSYNNEV